MDPDPNWVKIKDPGLPHLMNQEGWEVLLYSPDPECFVPGAGHDDAAPPRHIHCRHFARVAVAPAQ